MSATSSSSWMSPSPPPCIIYRHVSGAVLQMRFVEDLTQTEIATRVGVSQMQVSRLLRRSLDELRALTEASAGTR